MLPKAGLVVLWSCGGDNYFIISSAEPRNCQERFGPHMTSHTYFP